MAVYPLFPTQLAGFDIPTARETGEAAMKSRHYLRMIKRRNFDMYR